MINRHLVSGIIYGPVDSRRFGPSLGINISGNGKFCSFDCIYCFRGSNTGTGLTDEHLTGMPDAEMVKIALIKWLMEHPADIPADWTVAGNAEPTDNPDFPDIIEALIDIRKNLRSKKHDKEINISVLSNGMGLLPVNFGQCTKVLKALKKTDRPCLKLDSMVPETWNKIAKPAASVNLQNWLEAAADLRNKYIQTMLFKGRVTNSIPEELAALKAGYDKLAPVHTDILTINKPPLDSGLQPLSDEELETAMHFLTKNF